MSEDLNPMAQPVPPAPPDPYTGGLDFFIVTAEGRIRMSGQVNDLDQMLINGQEGETGYPVKAPAGMTHFINGQFEDRNPKPDYTEYRKFEYPPMTELADALYWQSRGDNSKMEAYLLACEAVKAKYPKPP